MLYVITQNKIYKGKSIKEINRAVNGQMDLDEFHPVGTDLIVNFTSDNLDFVQDKKKLSSIMFGNFFKKDTTTRNFLIINTILVFLCFVKIMGMA